MSKKWLVLAAVACGTFMATLDSSIVNIALHNLTVELGTNLSQIKWVVIIYFMVITCLLLPFGRVSDQYGRKRIFCLGFLIFTAGSAICGFAPNLHWLIIARVIQGSGASMLMANAPAIITDAFPPRERGTALGVLAMIVSVGLIAGPSLGGLLIVALGWRSIFLVNIPVGVLGMLLAWNYIKTDPPPKRQIRFDWLGSFLQSVLVVMLIFIFDPPQFDILGSGSSPVSRALAGLVVLLLGYLFIQVEKHSPWPVFDLSLLRIHTFSMANLAGFFTFVAYSAIAVLMPFFLEEVLQLTTDTAGFLMTAVPITILFIAPISGRLSDHFGSKELCVAGALVESVALFAMAGIFGRGLHEEISLNMIAFALCSIGLGMGLFQSPNNNAVMSVVPNDKLGAASAIIATVRNLGLVSGAGLTTVLFSWKQGTSGDSVSAIHFTYLISGLIALAALFSSLSKPRGPHWKEIGNGS